MKFKSLFTKFALLIFLATAVGIVSTHFAFYLNFLTMRKNLPVSECFQQNAASIALQFNINNKELSKKLLHDNNLELRYVNGTVDWSSSNEVPSLNTILHKSDGKPAFWFRNKMIYIIKIENATYIFMSVDPFKQFGFPWHLASMWSGLMILLFGFIYYKTREWLKPLRVLHAGVNQAGEGNFLIDLPRTTSDELGQLIDSFNSMALKVRTDIKSRDQLLRDISHELRSPLSRMMVALEFIPDGNIRQTLKNNILALEKMTVSILEEERIDSPYGKIKREPFDLKAMIVDLIDNRNQFGRSVVELISDEPLEINADKERIRMALSNVLDNSIKYSRDNNKPVEVSYHNAGNTATISIHDFGIGIPEADIPFIFEPFFRVDKARLHSTGGYGLGMSLTKKIIDAHKGKISINSKLNSGTTFTIELPMTE